MDDTGLFTSFPPKKSGYQACITVLTTSLVIVEEAVALIPVLLASEIRCRLVFMVEKKNQLPLLRFFDTGLSFHENHYSLL